MRPTWKVGVIATVAALAACGGGGGGNDDDSAGAAPATAALTGANYVAAATAAALMTSVVENTAWSSFSYFYDTSSAISTHSLRDLLASAIPLRRHVAGTQTSQGACDSGTETIQTTLASADGPSVGDGFSMVAKACLDSSASAIYDGRYALTITAVESDHLDMAAVPTGYTVTDTATATRVTMTGTLKVRLSYDASDNLVITSSTNAWALDVGDSAVRSMALSGYRLQETVTSSGSSSTLSDAFAGDLTDSLVGGRVHVQSLKNFVIAGTTDANPTSGQARITGTGGSGLLMEPQGDATSVKLSLDADGDAAYETSTTVTWTSLGL